MSRYTWWALAVIAAATLFRLSYSTHLELVGDEAYYWLWSRRLDICYLDKGPVIAWFIALGTTWFGQTVFGIRFFAVMLAAGTGLVLYWLCKRMFSDRVAFWTVLVGACVPLFAVGATLMTIDTVYVFFWTLAAATFWEAIQSDRWIAWLATGVLIGLGLLSKYTAAFELISFLLFCCWHGPSRRYLWNGRFFLVIVVAGLFLVPVIYWNVQHHWPTSQFLVHRGALDEQFHLRPLDVLSFLAQQAGVISPILFVGMLLAVFNGSYPGTERAAVLYAKSLFLPLFLAYFLLSWQRAGQANWTAAAYVGAMMLVAARFSQPKTWGARLAMIAAISVAVGETAVLHETAWLHLPPRIDVLNRARGSRDLAAQVASLQLRTGAGFVIANKYMTASLLSFYLPGQPETFIPTSSAPFNQLVIWPTYEQVHPDEDALLVSDTSQIPSSLDSEFAEIHSLGEITTVSHGRTIGHYHVFVCRRQARTEAGS